MTCSKKLRRAIILVSQVSTAIQTSPPSDIHEHAFPRPPSPTTSRCSEAEDSSQKLHLTTRGVCSETSPLISSSTELIQKMFVPESSPLSSRGLECGDHELDVFQVVPSKSWSSSAARSCTGTLSAWVPESERFCSLVGFVSRWSIWVPGLSTWSLVRLEAVNLISAPLFSKPSALEMSNKPRRGVFFFEVPCLLHAKVCVSPTNRCESLELRHVPPPNLLVQRAECRRALCETSVSAPTLSQCRRGLYSSAATIHLLKFSRWERKGAGSTPRFGASPRSQDSGRSRTKVRKPPAYL